MKTIRIGSRNSALAIAQSEWVKRQVEIQSPGTKVIITPMVTIGDIKLENPLMKIGGKGLFTGELETALRNCEIDIAVHSLKDMPQETNEDLPLIALSKREDPRDAIVLPAGRGTLSRGSASDSPGGSITGVLGTSSLRRMLQARRLFLERISFKTVRGNVNSRLMKLDSGEFDILILAVAGLERLGFRDRITRILDTDVMIPAAGQGILAVQGRRDDDYSIVIDAVNDLGSQDEYLAESSFVRALGATCASPVGVFARKCGTELKISAIAADFRDEVSDGAAKRELADPYVFENVMTGEIIIDARDAAKAGEMLLRIMRSGEEIYA